MEYTAVSESDFTGSPCSYTGVLSEIFEDQEERYARLPYDGAWSGDYTDTTAPFDQQFDVVAVVAERDNLLREKTRFQGIIHGLRRWKSDKQKEIANKQAFFDQQQVVVVQNETRLGNKIEQLKLEVQQEKTNYNKIRHDMFFLDRENEVLRAEKKELEEKLIEEKAKRNLINDINTIIEKTNLR